MAIVPITPTKPNDTTNARFIMWPNMANGDTGQPLEIQRYPDKTVHIYGTFGAGGSVTIQGSNDPRVISDPSNAVWTTLTDPQANALTKTSAAIEVILESPRYIRPSVTAGDGTTSITVVICA